MSQRYIVPVDGSAAAWTAVDVAMSLAVRTGATVHVVGVAFAPEDITSARSHLEPVLDTRLPSEVEVRLDIELGDSSVAAVIDELVGVHPGSVVIMSSHGRGRSAALVGSVADDILQRTFGPIMVVGPNVTVDDFTGPVVVSVDGSPESEAALPLAAAWAIELGVEPWIVHVVKPDGPPPAGMDVADSAYPARLAQGLERQTGHLVGFEELHQRHPTTAIPEFAHGLGASLIVASSHGRSGLSRLTVGSVTSGFVRHAVCPVLVIRLPIPASNAGGADVTGAA